METGLRDMETEREGGGTKTTAEILNESTKVSSKLLDLMAVAGCLKTLLTNLNVLAGSSRKLNILG